MNKFELLEIKVKINPETEEIEAETIYNTTAFPEWKYDKVFEKIQDEVAEKVQVLINKQYGGN